MKFYNKFFISFLVLLLILTQAKYISYSKNIPFNEKVLYLTFDDGPDKKVTSKILDILKQKKAKATFFVIGRLVEQEPLLTKRIVQEGHAIGLHSFSHDKNKLYKNEESFLEEMLKTQNLIFNITNIKTNILRFPFGSNNKSYKLNNNMLKKLHNNNYKIFDWDIDSGDGLNPYSNANIIFKNCKNAKNNSVILMHCGLVNENSTKALPLIIDYYKNQGFIFKVMDENTKEIYNIK